MPFILPNIPVGSLVSSSCTVYSCNDQQKSSHGMNYFNNENSKMLSHWRGNTSKPLKNVTIGQLVEEAAAMYPNKIAISFYKGHKLTYAEVLDKVDALAAAFINLGLKKGDHLGLWGFNNIEWYISFLAGFRAGLVVVNLNPLNEAAELLPCLKIGDVRALVMDEQLGYHDFYEILKSAIPEIEDFQPNTHLKSENLPLLKTVVMFSENPHKGTFNWCSLFPSVTNDQKLQIRNNQHEINSFDICNLQFTSGTTSQPKGVLLTHYSLANSGLLGADSKGFNEKEHLICVQIPFFHSYGEVHGILAAVASGSTVILPSAKFSPNKTIDCIIDEKCTIIYGTPTMYNDILEVSIERASHDSELYNKLSSVRIFHIGGAPCPPRLLSHLKSFFKGSQVMPGYGMTETSATSFLSSAEDSDDIVLSTVGRVLDHVEVKIVDENDHIVPLGIPGELCCRGYMIMKGYYKEPEKTKEVLTHDGWLRTGDRAILLENGYGQIVGRIKDLIIRGGENIDPQEIEEVLIKHPDIIDVQVFGVNDTRLGEVVGAAVIKRENSSITEENVKNFCNKDIASHKIPRYVIFVENFPKTAAGKIQKFKLKEITEKRIAMIV